MSRRNNSFRTIEVQNKRLEKIIGFVEPQNYNFSDTIVIKSTKTVASNYILHSFLKTKVFHKTHDSFVKQKKLCI